MADYSRDGQLAGIQHDLTKEIADVLAQRSAAASRSATRVFTRTVDETKPLALSDIVHQPSAKSVTIVENIDLPWIEAFGEAWGIHPCFFTEHIIERVRSPVLWLDVFGSSPANQRRPSFFTQYAFDGSSGTKQVSAMHWHVDGIVNYGWGGREKLDFQSVHNVIPRRHAHNAMSGWYELTRVSCYRTVDLAYLILIDAPRIKASTSSTARTELRLPVANNRGGLVVPEMYDENQFSLWQCFRQFLSHSWHFDVLFPPPPCLPISPETLFHLLIASTWKANLRIVNAQIHHISFHELRRPNILTNDHLHARRQDLVTIQTVVAETRTWIPKIVRAELKAIAAASVPDEHSTLETWILPPDELLGETLKEAAQVEKFLMDSFHLLLSSIGVLEAKASIEQARRAQRLTQLAFLYIPLSFVTGLFGMNIREINGAAPPLWVFGCALAITAGATAGVFWAFVWWERIFSQRAGEGEKNSDGRQAGG